MIHCAASRDSSSDVDLIFLRVRDIYLEPRVLESSDDNTGLVSLLSGLDWSLVDDIKPSQ